tara:strand:+ start:2046 stop:4892 length:2847 start_codon:yes stop_codon:yes gene_type:complete
LAANGPLKKISMVSENEIKEFLEGNDPEKYIVSVEYDYRSDCVYKVIEDPIKGKSIQRDTFIPFAWVGDFKGFKFYGLSKDRQKAAMTKHKIVIDKLRTDGNDRLENGMKYLVKSLNGYRSLIQFFKEGGLDPWGDDTKHLITVLSPVEQFLMSKEKRLFKGFEEYDDITRLVFDLETTSLEPKDGRIFMIGIKTNKGYQKVIECSTEEQERNGIIQFFKIIAKLKPSIIGGYNSANFDWFWIFERAKKLNLDLKKIVETLNPNQTIRERESMLKLANEVEIFNQVSMWGYNIIDILHSVRRAQAINSSIKSAGLKYITKFIDAEAEDRIYIDHTDIGPMYAKKEDYILNIKNGNYRKLDKFDFDELDRKFPNSYIKTTGDDIVERYLDDDLEETLIVDDEFNQGTFLLASLVPTTYQRVSTMGTATLWKMIMLAYSYKHGLALPMKEEKTDFVGGLSRLLTVGYSTDVLKLDYSSLYPSIQLVHDVFPECDINGAMKGLLSYFRNSRIKYKNLAAEYASIDKKKSVSYGRKQLPIKIFINSLFGALSAPHVFAWGDMFMGEQITTTGRQYLRQLVIYFTQRGYKTLVLDTDGVNFSLPEGGVDHKKYIGKGNNWLVKKDKVYTGYDADVAEYNDLFMKGEMGLDCDGTWDSCINLARKNYATMETNGKIKLTGNTIKSKKLPLYIEAFLDIGVRNLLEGKGQDFVEWYYEYIEKIFNRQVPLKQIASRARVKLSIPDYIKRSKTKTKSGGSMSAMAHMELAMANNLKVNLGDVIFYVNNGEKASHGDVQRKNKWKANAAEKRQYRIENGVPMSPDSSELILNCYQLDAGELEENPDMLGEYNIARAIATFNKRINPLLVVFDKEVREKLLVTDPNDRGFFTKDQCKLISGLPFKEGDQDKLEDLLQIEERELDYWGKRGIDPNYIYDLAEEGWENVIDTSKLINYVN